jgi:Mg2+ and Co2+ transporter CorA
MRTFHLHGDQFAELASPPAAPPAGGFIWIACDRSEFDSEGASIQAVLQRLAGGQLVDLHVSDLLNPHLPSHFDATSWYDLLVFRRLAAGPAGAESGPEQRPDPSTVVRNLLEAIDTSPVGFALFDRVLLTVHPGDCQVRDFFTHRLQQQSLHTDARSSSRLPPSSADLMLRMVNFMVDGYLELRRQMTRQLTQLQQALFHPRGRFANWQILLDSRNALHHLEDICEDQRSAIVEWIEELDDWPEESDAVARRERELLRVRSRDVLEHIERVLSHVRRLEGSAETAVQMHFSAQSNRTNSIMRTLTVLTAIFLPLNLVTGFFGMNFDSLPLVHSNTGLWIVIGALLTIGVALSLFFWRKRYLGSNR